MKKVVHLRRRESSEEFMQRSREAADKLAARFYSELGKADLHPDDLLRVIAQLLDWERKWADQDSLPRYGFGSQEVYDAFLEILRELEAARFRVVK